MVVMVISGFWVIRGDLPESGSSRENDAVRGGDGDLRLLRSNA